jgi:RNA polymerase sigma factor (sigma-70 family)
MKGFARSVPMMRAKSGTVTHEEVLAELPDASLTSESDRLVSRDHVRHLLSRLSDRERSVLEAHYGISAEGSGSSRIEQPATYEQVGERLGLSKQRVRQIEQTALAKLRANVVAR